MYKQNLAFVYLVLINYIKALTKQELNVHTTSSIRDDVNNMMIWWRIEKVEYLELRIESVLLEQIIVLARFRSSNNGHRIIQVFARYLWYVRIDDRLSLISSSPKPLTASPLFNNGNYFMPISSRPIFIFRRRNLLDSSSNQTNTLT